MSNQPSPGADPGHATIYQIRIKGHLGREWTDWFGGLAITLEDNGDTLLTRPGGRSGRSEDGYSARQESNPLDTVDIRHVQLRLCRCLYPVLQSCAAPRNPGGN